MVSKKDEQFIALVNEVFNERIPFNKTLGLHVESLSHDQATMSLMMRDELMGHFERKMLHGGVIATAIDVAGGLAALMGVHHKIKDEPLKTKIAMMKKLSTIDVRVDYLRPGTGNKFFVTAHVLRTGSKIAVTRIELKNEEDQLIAVGTGSYIVA